MERKLTLLDKLMRLPFLKKLVRQFVIRVTSLGAIRKALRSASQAGNYHGECGSGCLCRCSQATASGRTRIFLFGLFRAMALVKHSIGKVLSF